MPTTLNINSFKIFGPAGIGKFEHKISIGRFPGASAIWIRKEMESASAARSEQLSQEFFRLVIPLQPQTLIAWNPKLGTYYILSEEIPGYRLLPSGHQEFFTKGGYPGLGQIILTAIFVQEIDLKNGNIGLNAYNQVVKIDGGWSFASLRRPEWNIKNTITLKLLTNLPYPTGIKSFHWLDIIQKSVAQPSSQLINPATIANAPHFRAEINQAMLKILLLPSRYIQKFVDAYIPVGASQFIQLISERQEQLKISAMQEPSFLAYLASPYARENAKQHLQHMKQFCAQENQRIIGESDFPQLEQDYDLLLKEFLPKEPELKPTHFWSQWTAPDRFMRTNERGLISGMLAGALATTGAIMLRMGGHLSSRFRMPKPTTAIAMVWGGALISGALGTILHAGYRTIKKDKLLNAKAAEPSPNPSQQTQSKRQQEIQALLHDFRVLNARVERLQSKAHTRPAPPQPVNNPGDRTSLRL